LIEKTCVTQYGVSPAFVFSRHTTNYSVEDFRKSLLAARALGFSAFQPEIYHQERVAEWLNGGGAQIARLARELDLHVSQFVAHFLMPAFASRARLADHSDLEALKRVAEEAARFPGCAVLTVPLARFQPEQPPISHAELWGLLRDKVAACLAIACAAGLRLALELLPYSLPVNSEGFLRLAAEIGSPDLGVNLDTGHAWAQREVMELLPSKLRGRIFGVHLKDNNSDVNLPLAPGKGTIPWVPLLRGLRAAGYTGSWDIEIGCAPERVEIEYKNGLEFLKSLKIDQA
jgi:sugar phosphate isomerase/epimerase